MMFNVLALGATAFGMIRVARKLRGSTLWTDAFFPLALLQLGQSENLLHAFQIVFVISAVLLNNILIVIAGHRSSLTFRGSVLAGICLILLPLCGAQGLILVPPLSLWLLSAAVLHWTSNVRRSKATSAWMITSCVLSLLLCLLYFRGYSKPPVHPLYNRPCPGIGALLGTSLEFLTASLGPKSADLWPYSGWMVLGMMLVSAGLLLREWWERPNQRFRVQGLLAFLAAMTMLSLGIGWGRSGLGPGMGFTSRYVTLAIPVLCCVYFVWVLYGRSGWGRIGRMTLMGLMCALMVPSTRSSVARAEAERRTIESMEQDLHAGMPISAFLARYNGRNFVFPPPVTNPPISNEVARKHIGMLQRARVGKFRYVRPDAPLREMPMPIVPKECHDISWDDGLGRKSGADPYLVFGLPRTAFVYGIRLTYVVEHLKGSAPIRVSWSRTDRHEVAVAESSLLLNVETAKEQVTTIPVNDSIDRYRIELDSPTSSIRISKIMLILPPPLTVQR